jgi:S-adenosylmethionine hydrolase
MTVITLLTDFGLCDGYPGVLKGVIWKIAPHAQIADISHAIQPQNIFHGALALARTAPFFPPGTIHVAVVDPGVGTQRRPVGLHLGKHFFIGPDNGIFTLVLESAESHGDSIQVFHLNQSSYWLPDVSRVFHGRDIFAPVAAHLASGIPLEKMGTVIHDPVRLEIPHPEPIRGGGWRGEIIYIDHFGNLTTNLNVNHLYQTGRVIIRIQGKDINGIVSTYGEQAIGTLIALLDSNDYLEVSVVNGNAAKFLQANIGGKLDLFPIK